MKYGISVRNASSTQIVWYLVCPFISQLPNHFEIMHRARQYHYRALCKISKRLNKWSRYYGLIIFCEIWVSDEFRTDIRYCTALLFHKHTCNRHAHVFSAFKSRVFITVLYAIVCYTVPLYTQTWLIRDVALEIPLCHFGLYLSPRWYTRLFVSVMMKYEKKCLANI